MINIVMLRVMLMVEIMEISDIMLLCCCLWLKCRLINNDKGIVIISFLLGLVSLLDDYYVFLIGGLYVSLVVGCE